MTGIKNRCSPSPRSRTQILGLSRYASFVKCVIILSAWFLNNSLKKRNYFTKQKNCKALNISTSFYMHSMMLFSCKLKKKLFWSDNNLYLLLSANIFLPRGKRAEISDGRQLPCHSVKVQSRNNVIPSYFWSTENSHCPTKFWSLSRI